MSRSRFAGVALDRMGNPVSPQAFAQVPRMHMDGRDVVAGPGMEPVPEAPAITHYYADKATIARDIDAWELAQLINLQSVTASPEKYQALRGDLWRHFRPAHATEFVRQGTNKSSG